MAQKYAKHIKTQQSWGAFQPHFWHLLTWNKACMHVREELQYYHIYYHHIAFIDLVRGWWRFDRFGWRTVASPSSMVSLGVRRPKKTWDHGWPWSQSNSFPWWLHGKFILSILQMLLSRSPKLYGSGWNVMLRVYGLVSHAGIQRDWEHSSR